MAEVEKITRVIFEYGTEQKYIVGEQLQKWQDFNAIVAKNAQRDGINPPWEDIVWKDSSEDIFY